MAGKLLSEHENFELRDRLAAKLMAAWMKSPDMGAPLDGEVANEYERKAKSYSRAALLAADAFIAARLEHQTKPR